MAGCVISTSILRAACGDRFGQPGISQDDVWISNFDDLEGNTRTALKKEISALDYITGKQAYKFAMEKNTGQFDAELTSETSGSFYSETFTAKILDGSSTTAQTIEDYVDVPVVIVARLNDGSYVVMGLSGNLTMTGDAYSSGAASGDDRGSTLTWTGDENERFNYFFDTDAATTKATLVGYETPAV